MLIGLKLRVILVSILAGSAFGLFEFTGPLSDLSSNYLVTNGAVTGMVSITDGTASWSANRLSSFTSITAATVTGTTITDGTLTITGGVVTAGEWAGTAIDISGYTNLTAGSGITLTDDTLSVSGAGVDHGKLSGLTDDDHTQYLLIAGTRAMTGNLNMGDKNITNVVDLTVTGNSLFGDGTTDTHDFTGVTTKGDGGTTNYSENDETGSYTAYGTARFKRSVVMLAEGFKAPGTKPAELVELGIGYGWAFDDADAERVLCHYMTVPEIDRANIIQPALMLHWGGETADPGDDTIQARWQVEYLWISPGEDLTNATPDDTLVDNYSTSVVANGYVETKVQLADFTASDKMLHVVVSRLADEAGDTLDGKLAYLHCACLMVVCNTHGTSISEYYILLETGDYLLLEAGDKMII